MQNDLVPYMVYTMQFQLGTGCASCMSFAGAEFGASVKRIGHGVEVWPPNVNITLASNIMQQGPEMTSSKSMIWIRKIEVRDDNGCAARLHLIACHGLQRYFVRDSKTL